MIVQIRTLILPVTHATGIEHHPYYFASELALKNQPLMRFFFPEKLPYYIISIMYVLSDLIWILRHFSLD